MVLLGCVSFISYFCLLSNYTLSPVDGYFEGSDHFHMDMGDSFVLKYEGQLQLKIELLYSVFLWICKNYIFFSYIMILLLCILWLCVTHVQFRPAPPRLSIIRVSYILILSS